ncbi:OmpA family protein [Brevundimonas sp.]
MWFRFVLIVGLWASTGAASAQSWSACYDAATDSLTSDGHLAVRTAAAAHLANPLRLSVDGWPGLKLDVGSESAEPTSDWRAIHRVQIELARLGVGLVKISWPDGVRYDSSVPARDVCVAISLAQVPVRTGHFDTVYFPENSAEITDAARFALERAFIDYVLGGRSVMLDGHSDTVGTSGETQALSERRTTAVAEALVRMGARWEDLEQRSWGENRLARPTGDEVAEPLNRRVTVNFRTRPEPAH